MRYLGDFAIGRLGANGLLDRWRQFVVFLRGLLDALVAAHQQTHRGDEGNYVYLHVVLSCLNLLLAPHA